MPGLHRGEPVSLEEFQRRINCELRFNHGEVMNGLIKAFGLQRPRGDEEIAAPTLAYVLGRIPSLRAM